MSRWIDADKRITVQFYDDMYEEWSIENMTIAEYLNRYTEEGCPSTEPKRPKGEWIDTSEGTFCSECDFKTNEYYNYCPNCGCDCRGDKE